MEREQIQEKLQELESKVTETQKQKDVLMADIGKAETEIKIKQSKIIDIDESMLTIKGEITKYKNCLEILDR